MLCILGSVRYLQSAHIRCMKTTYHKVYLYGGGVAMRCPNQKHKLKEMGLEARALNFLGVL